MTLRRFLALSLLVVVCGVTAATYYLQTRSSAVVLHGQDYEEFSEERDGVYFLDEQTVIVEGRGADPKTHKIWELEGHPHLEAYYRDYKGNKALFLGRNGDIKAQVDVEKLALEKYKQEISGEKMDLRVKKFVSSTIGTNAGVGVLFTEIVLKRSVDGLALHSFSFKGTVSK